MDVESCWFALKAGFAQVWGLHPFAWPWPSDWQTPRHIMPVHLHVPPVSSVSSTFTTSPGLDFSILFPLWAPNVTKPQWHHKEGQTCTICTASCRTLVTPGGTKHREKKGWKQLTAQFSKANAFKPFPVNTQIWYTRNYRSTFHNSNNTDESNSTLGLAFN